MIFLPIGNRAVFSGAFDSVGPTGNDPPAPFDPARVVALVTPPNGPEYSCEYGDPESPIEVIKDSTGRYHLTVLIDQPATRRTPYKCRFRGFDGSDVVLVTTPYETVISS
jgi:hypothetical protein